MLGPKSDGSPRISNEEEQIKKRQRSADIKVMFDRVSVRCRVCGIQTLKSLQQMAGVCGLVFLYSEVLCSVTGWNCPCVSVVR